MMDSRALIVLRLIEKISRIGSKVFNQIIEKFLMLFKSEEFCIPSQTIDGGKFGLCQAKHWQMLGGVRQRGWSNGRSHSFPHFPCLHLPARKGILARNSLPLSNAFRDQLVQVLPPHPRRSLHWQRVHISVLPQTRIVQFLNHFDSHSSNQPCWKRHFRLQIHYLISRVHATYPNSCLTLKHIH